MYKRFLIIFLTIISLLIITNHASADEDTPFPLKFNFAIEKSDNPKDIAPAFQLMIIFTLITLAPALLTMVTCFTRIAVILSFMKNALKMGQQPSNQIIIGLSLFLTFYIMAPVGEKINNDALTPYLEEQITQKQALDVTVKHLRTFMFKYAKKKDIALFVNIAKMEKPNTRDDIPTHILIPAYIISELKTAFQIGFLLFLPFLVIDMVVASILLSMGMIVLPPITISTPFKVLLFVMVDGWNLIVSSITLGF
ncbi:MAG: flagellar type III secretion system pore protein FliP [Candidatus Aureabacteria bacterium]|nr:flagellar type III secretion system pore protein FliP [Candidatus Auribacterota bacterium]